MGFNSSHDWRRIRLQKINDTELFVCLCCNHSTEKGMSFHHIEYPEDIRDTTSEQLVILCWKCHRLIHCLDNMGAVNSLNVNDPIVLDKMRGVITYLNLPIYELTDKRINKAKENKEKIVNRLQLELSRARKPKKF